MPTVATRQPTLTIVRPHAVEPGCAVKVAGNIARLPNGDGAPTAVLAGPVLPGSAYDSPLASGLPLWESGQESFLGGGFLDGGFLEDAAAPVLGMGFLDAGFLDGPFLDATGDFTYRVPFPLRDGTYLLGVRLTDALGNEQTGTVNEVAFTVAALPRAPQDARIEGYAAGLTTIAWDASPDIEEYEV